MVVLTSASLVRSPNLSTCVCLHVITVYILIWSACVSTADCKSPAWLFHTAKKEEEKKIPLSHPPHERCCDPSPHDSWLVILLAPAFVYFNNSENSKGWKKKKRWKESTYLSFPIVYLFHGKLIFTSPVTGSSLGSTARPVWLSPQLPSPSLGFMTWLWGGLLRLSTHKSFQWYNTAFV